MADISYPSPQTDRISFGDRSVRVVVIRYGLSLCLIFAALFSLGWGAASDTDVIGAIFAKAGIGQVSLRDTTIVWDIRMPRMLTAGFVGGALAISGAIMQGLFRNPLADPGLIGISSGASFGAVLAIVLGSLLPAAFLNLVGLYLVPLAAFVAAWITMILLYAVSTRGGRTSVATMLLAGIALGALTGAITGIVVYYATDDQLRDLTFWQLGSVAGATWSKFFTAAPFMVATFVVAPFLAKSLNALALGESAAMHMGIATQRMKTVAILSVAASVGAAVAITGGIGFVGLVVPHLLRLVQGPDHQGLLLNSALLGALVLLITDAIARVVIAPAELPIGIVTALMGAPFFLWILLRNRSVVDL